MNSRRSYRWFQLRRTVNCHSDLPSPRPPIRTISQPCHFPFPPFPFLSNATHQHPKKSIFAHVNRLNSLSVTTSNTLRNRQSQIACAGYSRTIHFPLSLLFLVLVFPLSPWVLGDEYQLVELAYCLFLSVFT
jgi:hypothetical protein